MLSYTIFQSPTGPILADWSLLARDITIETTPRGYGTCTATIPLPRRIARQWYGILDNAHLVIKERGQLRYEGRIEIPETTPDGLALTAFGYSRAYSDIPVTDLWATGSVSEWYPITTAVLASRNPDMWEMDTNNRLFIGLQKNTTYPNGFSGMAALEFTVPDLSTNKLQSFSASYSVLAPAGFTIRVETHTTAYAASTTIWTLTATGVLQTGTITSTALAGRPIINFAMFNQSGAAVTYAGENGTNYAMLTSVRLTGSTSATITADEIARAFVSRVVTRNPLQVNSSTARIKSPGFDLKEFSYSKAEMGDVLDQLAALGGDGWLWSWRVWDQQLLIFDRIANGGQVYQVYSTPDISRDLGSLRTAIYPIYTNATDQEVQGTSQINTQAEARANLRRIAYFDAPTTSSADANTLAAAYLLDQSIVNAFGDITVSALWQNGQRVPLGVLRSGDTIQCVEFPTTGNSETDKTRQFRVGTTSYDVTNRTLTISPEQRAPKIDSILARRDISLVGT